MKTLILCRHAKSDWPDGVADIERPLAVRGFSDARYLGRILADQQFSPQLILSSPALRAHTTAQLIAHAVGYSEERISLRTSIYHEGVGSLTELVKSLPNNVDQVMIFGHNPTMEQAVRFYLQMEARYDMPTGGMVAFESDQRSWASFFPPFVRLRWHLIPRLQRKHS